MPTPKSSPPPPLNLPLSPSNPHQQLLILDRDPTGQHLHGIFEIRIEQDLPRAVDQRRRRRVQDVEAAGEAAAVRGGAGLGVAEEHEDVPDAQLRGEGDRVVEQGQIPAGAVRGGRDV